MSARTPLRRWSSTSRPDRQAAELLFEGGSFEPAMRRAARQVGDATFLVVNVDLGDPADVRNGIAAFHAAGGTTRVCLAGDRSTLAAYAGDAVDRDRVGLLLDAVDARTPCVDIAWDGIEAVRFSDAFVDEAARSLRLGCILESMLGLAGELGLRTLGGTAQSGGGSLSDRAGFHYVAVDGPSASPLPPDRSAKRSSRPAATLVR